MSEAHVLVVEDDPSISRLFRDMLPARDIEVTVVGTAEAAFEAIEVTAFDLVITDKNLPGVSGLELLARIHTEQPDLDVIMMTAYADLESVLEAFRAGVYDYLLKPFPSIDEVLQKIERALEKRRMYLENLRLLEDLTIANARIEHMNRDLEQQIEDRTNELQEANERLEELSLTDDVTGLYNQRYLYTRLEEELQREKRYKGGLAVIMLDIDHFKRVNDSHDHLFGSRVLNRVGEVLRACVRGVDYCVRYGGDEFVIILPHTQIDEAIHVANRIRATVEERDHGDDNDPYSLTVSVGVATVQDIAADSARTILRAADQALYEAKEGGRNRVVRASGAQPVGDAQGAAASAQEPT